VENAHRNAQAYAANQSLLSELDRAINEGRLQSRRPTSQRCTGKISEAGGITRTMVTNEIGDEG
jgi:hypothetical protein